MAKKLFSELKNLFNIKIDKCIPMKTTKFISKSQGQNVNSYNNNVIYKQM